MIQEISCVAKERQPSPKKEDCVTKFTFGPLKAPQGHHGDHFLHGSLVVWDRDDARYEVGKHYALELESPR